ncbi:MAG: electron transport complex subunit E [Oscillospiraceae bacterium]|jgi:electron transport complex protein RnfE|nr:electron transport complex subunit E [Oscillospiraceae bacterium]
MTKLNILTRGIIKENPVFMLLLGLCPVLAVTTQAENAIGMGLATTFVLLGSNIVISILRKIIPNRVRIPCYIVLIASFTVLAKMIIEAYAYPIYQSLGIFLPLIAANCIIFARAEIFANKNGSINSILDALGFGAGFTLALLAIASIREIFGNGSWFGVEIPWLTNNSAMIFTLAPGGFIVLACLLAVVNKISKDNERRKNIDCKTCPNACICGRT